ncbi:MAG: hypothetical protein V1775_04370 [Bacteroidota bacterium]
MLKNPGNIIGGAGIGLLGGLLIGITDSDWIRLLIALALMALSGNSLKGSILKADITLSQSFTGVAAFVAILAGLYINGQEIFKQSPSDAIDKWVKAGYSPEESQGLYLRQWEWENRKDSEPSQAVQVMIKSILDSMKPDDDKEADDDSGQTQPDIDQDSIQGEPVVVEEELPVLPAEG